MPVPHKIEANASPVFGFISNHPALIEFEGEGDKCKAVILGANENFLIVKTAKPANHRKPIGIGGNIVVKLERNGVIIGFKAKILNYLRQPSHLLFVSCPKEIEQINLRNRARIECRIPVDVACQGGACGGQMLDISDSGCRIAIFPDERSGAWNLANGLEVGVRIATGCPSPHTFFGLVKSVKERADAVIIGVLFQPDRVENQGVAVLVEDLACARQISAAVDEEDIDYINDMELLESGDGRRSSAAYSGKARLEPGMNVYCHFTGDNTLEEARILGIDSHTFAILDYESLLCKKNIPKPSAGLRVIFTRDSAYYSFRTPITKFITKPRPMVFFNCPGKLDVFQVRKSPRIGCLIPAAIESNLLRGRAHLSDLSEGGCRLVTDFSKSEIISNIAKDYALAVSFPVNGSRCVTITAVTRRFFSDGSDIILGMSFRDSQEKMAAVKEAMVRLQAASSLGAAHG